MLKTIDATYRSVNLCKRIKLEKPYRTILHRVGGLHMNDVINGSVLSLDIV
jgi:hypothetical protein